MQAKKSLVSMAIVSLFTASGAALAYGPGPHDGGMGPRAGAPMDPAQRAERVQTRLGTLKEALKLQPNQLDAWNAYSAKIASESQARAEMRKSMIGLQGDAQAMADQRVAMMKRNAAAAEEVNGLRKALVATLSPEQKATFDQYSMGPRFAGGPGAAGPGPGHGRGPGGRGPGFGCGGAA